MIADETLFSIFINVWELNDEFTFFFGLVEFEFNSIEEIQTHHVNGVLSCVDGFLADVMVVDLGVVWL